MDRYTKFLLLFLCLLCICGCNDVQKDTEREGNDVETATVTQTQATEISIQDIPILLYDANKDWYSLNEEIYETREMKEGLHLYRFDVADPSELEDISTENLLAICLDNRAYQLFVSIYDEQNQFISIEECCRTSFLPTLLARMDAKECLLSAYSEYPVNDTNDADQRLRMLESILGSQEIYPNLTKEEKETLCEISKRVILEKQATGFSTLGTYFFPELVKWNGFQGGYRPDYESLVSADDAYYQEIIEDWNSFVGWE